MILNITGYNNFFKIKGILNKKSVQQFNEALYSVLDLNNEIIISLEDLDTIDHYGLTAIAKLHNEAITKNKRLSIVGCGNNNLLEYFKSEDAA